MSAFSFAHIAYHRPILIIVPNGSIRSYFTFSSSRQQKKTNFVPAQGHSIAMRIGLSFQKGEKIC